MEADADAKLEAARWTPQESLVNVGKFGEGFTAVQQQDCRCCLQHYTVLNLDRDIAWAASQTARQRLRW